MRSMESLRRDATDGVAEWLSQLLDSLPNVVPPRTDPTEVDPANAGWLHKFVRDVVTTNPATHEDLSNIQIYMVELALDAVDWDELAREPRFGRFDWSHAHLTSP
jgi:hypothetical protein